MSITSTNTKYSVCIIFDTRKVKTALRCCKMETLDDYKDIVVFASVLYTRCRSNVSIGNGINRFSVFFFFDIMLIRKFQRFLVQQIWYRIRIQCVSKCVRCVIMSYISMLESSFIRWICPTMNMQLNLKFTALFYRNFARNSLNLDLFLFTFEIIFLLGRILV